MKNKAVFIDSMRRALDLLHKVVIEMPVVTPDMVDAMSYIEHAMQQLPDEDRRLS